MIYTQYINAVCKLREESRALDVFHSCIDKIEVSREFLDAFERAYHQHMMQDNPDNQEEWKRAFQRITDLRCELLLKNRIKDGVLDLMELPPEKAHRCVEYAKNNHVPFRECLFSKWRDHDVKLKLAGGELKWDFKKLQILDIDKCHLHFRRQGIEYDYDF